MALRTQEQLMAERDNLQKEYEAKLADQKINEQGYACIRIFEDGTVFITDQDGKLLLEDPPTLQEPDGGPWNTYDQAVWFHRSPT